LQPVLDNQVIEFHSLPFEDCKYRRIIGGICNGLSLRLRLREKPIRKKEAGSKAIGKRAVGGGLHEVGCRFGPQDKDFNLKTSNEARLFLNQKPRTGCLS